MKARATCFGAGTIVNAIATGNGAAFGLALRVTATAEIRPEAFRVQVHVPAAVDPALAASAAKRVLKHRGRVAGLEVSVESEIPPSRGLKSSSAVANAVVLASARALDANLEPSEIIRIGIEAAFDAGVTITGAFDDACASFFGGVVVTNNPAKTLLATGRLREGLVAVVQIPQRRITKSSLQGMDFSTIQPQVDEAFRLALAGDYLRALEMNSAAYAPLLGIDQDPAVRARSAGAVAAGLTGTGPAFIALTTPDRVDAVRRAMDDEHAEVRVVGLNTTESREVVA